MLKKTLGLVVTAVILFGLFGLAACNNDTLGAYKAAGKASIETYANERKNNYCENNWAVVCGIVASGKTAIDAAESKPDVDVAVSTAKEGINEVEYKKEPILPMDGAEEYAEGNGTETAPYIIYNLGQLIYFSNQINDGINRTAYFSLGANINMGGMEWTPIGIFEHYNDNDVFTGVFDGNGYEISNFSITVRRENSSAKNIGLFGFNGGIIKNLGVVDADIDITWSYKLGYNLSVSAGSLAGSNIGEITNCYAFGSINLEYNGGATITAPAHIRTGGLVGYSTGNLTNCYSTVDVNAAYNNEAGTVYAAGLVVGGKAQNCFVTGNVTAKYAYHTLSGESKAFSIGGEMLNCYAYEGQIVDTLKVASCSAVELNTTNYYTNQLKWNTAVWNFENISFIEGKFIDNKYPKLY